MKFSLQVATAVVFAALAHVDAAPDPYGGGSGPAEGGPCDPHICPTGSEKNPNPSLCSFNGCTDSDCCVAASPSAVPSVSPSGSPSVVPSTSPSVARSASPSAGPSTAPSGGPTSPPTLARFRPQTNRELRDAVAAWNDNATDAETMYGDHIKDWDTSQITDMRYLFAYKHKHLVDPRFNEDISRWNVAGVTNFHQMFVDATSFNQDLSGWNVGEGTDFDHMFRGATSFNQDLSGWNVGKGTIFGGMFRNAISFNSDLSGWNVGKGTLFGGMFWLASSFNQDLSGWNVGEGTDFNGMFKGASSFNQDLTGWNVGKGTNFLGMFDYAGDMSNALCWDSKPNLSEFYYDGQVFGKDDRQFLAFGRWCVLE
jgi:hypothetical protein